MNTTNTPFRTRARKTILQAIKLRLFLISTGKSRNSITTDQCKKIEQDISTLQSDYQFAKYIHEHYLFLEKMIPGVHENSKVQLMELLKEIPKLDLEFLSKKIKNETNKSTSHHLS